MLSRKEIQQAQDRQAHRERNKEQRLADDPVARQVAMKAMPTRMLLVCEGKNTEPSYFRQFHRANVKVKMVVEGIGGDPSRVVAYAKHLNDAESEPYDEVWCVIDRDNHAHFSSALQDARQLGFNAAWSNQSFEFWLLLHFEVHTGGGMHRDDYKGRLNHYLEPLGMSYDNSKPSKTVTEDIFLEMESFVQGRSRQEWAIDRARNIHEEKQAEGKSPADSESCTTVYQLVEVLQQFG